MITAQSWSGFPQSLGGGWGACIEWPTDKPLPEWTGSTQTIGGKDYKVLRVVRLYRDPKKKKAAARIALITSEDGGEKVGKV